MNDELQNFEDEIFEKYPDWINKLNFIDYLSGVKYGKGSPYAVVETPFGMHKVSVGNLRKGNYPTIKTANDQIAYAKNYSTYMIKILREELLSLKPEWDNKLDLIQYIPGIRHESDKNKIIEGGPFLKVKTKYGIHIVAVSKLRHGYFPSVKSAIELFDNEVKEINFTDQELSSNYTVVKKFNVVLEIADYLDISQIGKEKLELIKKTKIWFLVKDLSNNEYFFQRKASILANSRPSIKSAFNEISLLNKITPNDHRKFHITIIRRYGKIREELSYLIEWCGCQFVKEQSWILADIGREPLKLLGSVVSLVETANIVFQYRNPEMAKLFTIKEYLPNNKNARVILTDYHGIEYDFRWSDILEGKTPGLRSSITMDHYIYREMEEKNKALRVSTPPTPYFSFDLMSLPLLKIYR